MMLSLAFSQKIRLCVVDLEDQYQTTLQAKDSTFWEQHQQCAKSTGFDNSCKKQKENENNKSEFPDQKIDRFGQQSCLKLAFQINYTQPDFS